MSGTSLGIHESLLLTTLLAILWIFTLATYRVYFHPLAKYPGPLLAKLTDWYNVYHCFVGDRHIEFHRIHLRYGKIVRYGPNRVSINSATALRTIYSPKANCRKSSHFAVFPRFFHSWSTQTIVDTKKFNHSQKRRVISQALHGEAMKSINESIHRNLDRLCATLTDGDGSEWSAATNLSEILSYLSFDIMGDVCFGRSFKMIEDPENRYMIKVISDGAQCLNTLGHMQKLLLTGQEQSTRALQEITTTKRTGVFQELVSAKDPATGNSLFKESELSSESSLLMIAGSDTTATALSATLFYLLNNPTCLRQAQEEVVAAFEASREGKVGMDFGGASTSKIVHSCTYLLSCIDEALRLSPPVGGLMPRETLEGGMSVDGELFPADVEIGTPHYALHHNKEYFERPFEFHPQRWHVGSTPATQVLLSRSAFCAFSVGPRDCVGKTFAYHDMMSVLARLLWQFDLRIPPNGTCSGGGDPAYAPGRHRVYEFQLWDTFASKSDGPQVQFRLRQ
ncbi:Cytochrome P450 monooxygenase apf7 [Lachnellula suecica]|uniref:Cytochrome P450 monooxygenase apf7 n=1 Tax=Lachnellula suecica TaxID=602035 RepID=A0A8T9C5U7_9HELO|nr:Cytochrome P450 monooxygenase apf7 [Lachnellula suecica]